MEAWQFTLWAATAGTQALWPLNPMLCIMDWVEEVPERELPERDEERELGFISLALGASASSLKRVYGYVIPKCALNRSNEHYQLSESESDLNTEEKKSN